MLRSALRQCAPKHWKLSDFSPFVKKELRFNSYPRLPGGGHTLAAIIGANSGVLLAWKFSHIKALEGDESMLTFMNRHFIGTNHGSSELQNVHRIILSSFSHQDFGHFLGNMTALLLMGPRLHEFLGRARFLGLYVAGCFGGTLATQFLHLDPYYEESEIAKSPKRYYNILGDMNPGQAFGLGAQDAISALFACFYFTFPRQPVPFLWTKANLLWSMVPATLRQNIPIVGRVLNRTKAAAIWVLPAFFFFDFTAIWQRLTGPSNDTSGLMLSSNTGHAAHVGGFLAGSGFYALVAHPLKAQYFNFTAHERFRRAYILALSLSFWKGMDLMMKRANKDDPPVAKTMFVLGTSGPSAGGSLMSSSEADTNDTKPYFELDRVVGLLWTDLPTFQELVT